MKIYIGGDHAGFGLKERLVTYLEDLEHEVVDKGASAFDPADDYPDFITPVAEAVSKDSGSFGIILGGSGQGEAMCANRVKGARAAVFYGQVLPQEGVDVNSRASMDPFEIIKLMREHNDANILSLGVRFITEDEAKFAVELFLSTKFSGDERHVKRLSKF